MWIRKFESVNVNPCMNMNPGIHHQSLYLCSRTMTAHRQNTVRQIWLVITVLLNFLGLMSEINLVWDNHRHVCILRTFEWGLPVIIICMQCILCTCKKTSCIKALAINVICVRSVVYCSWSMCVIMIPKSGAPEYINPFHMINLYMSWFYAWASDLFQLW